jgi:hypothetical protein
VGAKALKLYGSLKSVFICERDYVGGPPKPPLLSFLNQQVKWLKLNQLNFQIKVLLYVGETMLEGTFQAPLNCVKCGEAHVREDLSTPSPNCMVVKEIFPYVDETMWGEPQVPRKPYSIYEIQIMSLF